MENSIAETLIGGAVVAAAAIFLIQVGGTTGGQIGGGDYELAARFRSADGIGVGTDVRVAGIPVGTVTDMALDTDTYQALLTFSLREDLKIPEDSDVKIAQEGLLGGSYLDITPGASEFMLADGGEILNTQGSVSLLNLLMRFGMSE